LVAFASLLGLLIIHFVERAELQRQIRELDPTINLAKEAAEEMKDEDEELDEDAGSLRS
jgi:hypothetical protein